MNTFTSKLQAIHDKMNVAKCNVGRNDTVQLCAVSKTQSAESVRSAYLAGQKIFGENYLQEALGKQALLNDCNIEWHFIGPIQSNKTQQIAQHFDWVHSVDRLKIAKRLSDARSPDQQPLNICLQLNISNEETKSGTNLEEVESLAKAVDILPNIQLRGLMAIPAPTSNKTEQQEQFQHIHQQYIALQQKGFGFDTLSIGMSNDFEIAITEGATIVRIGTALFGERSVNKQVANKHTEGL